VTYKNIHTDEIYEIYEKEIVEEVKGKKKRTKAMMMKWVSGTIEKPRAEFKCIEDWNKFGIFISTPTPHNIT